MLLYDLCCHENIIWKQIVGSEISVISEISSFNIKYIYSYGVMVTCDTGIENMKWIIYKLWSELNYFKKYYWLFMH